MENGRWTMENLLFYLLILFLPTQLGKHFLPNFSIIQGIRIDYLSPTVYFTDILICLLFTLWFYRGFVSKLIVDSGVVVPPPQKHTSVSGKRRQERIQNQFENLNLGFWIFIMLLLVNIFLSRNILNGLYHLFKFLEFSFVAYYVVVIVKEKVQLQMIMT